MRMVWVLGVLVLLRGCGGAKPHAVGACPVAQCISITYSPKQWWQSGCHVTLDKKQVTINNGDKVEWIDPAPPTASSRFVVTFAFASNGSPFGGVDPGASSGGSLTSAPANVSGNHYYYVLTYNSGNDPNSHEAVLCQVDPMIIVR